MEMTTKKTMSLDGEWDVLYDYNNIGKENQWFVKEEFYKNENITPIQVPCCLETQNKDYEGVAWYAKTVKPSNKYIGKQLFLQFDGVNYKCELWVNGIAVSYHKGGYSRFEIDVTGYLIAGEENFVSLRVITPIITKDITIDGIGKNEMPHWRAALAGGIYQSVRLKARENVYIKDIFAIPDMDNGKVLLEYEIVNCNLHEEEVSLCISVAEYKNDMEIFKIREDFLAKTGVLKKQISFIIPNAKLWDVNSPNLYTVECAIVSNNAQDITNIRFGFRKLDFNEDGFLLNGKPIYIKGAFSEELFPHTLAIPQDMEIVKRGMMHAKNAGLNLIRPWRRPMPEYIYDLADEIGIMYIGGIAVECMNRFPEITPYLKEQVENEVSGMILQHRNHPSIVIWELFNEIHRKPLHLIKHSTSLHARKLDPSRIIFDESGGFANGANMYHPFDDVPVRINDIHSYPNAPLEQSMYDLYMQMGQESFLGEGTHTQSCIKPNCLINISELGYGSLPNLEDNINEYLKNGNEITPDYRYHFRVYNSLKKVLAECKLEYLYKDINSYCLATQKVHYDGNKYMMESCRLNPKVGGIVMHAFTDGDWVFGAGVLDIFRNPKLPYYAFKEVLGETYIALRSVRPNYFENEEIVINLPVISEKNLAEQIISVEIEDTQGNCVKKEHVKCDIQKGITQPLPIKTCLPKGSYTITATLLEKTNAYKVHVLEEVKKISNLKHVAFYNLAQSSLEFLTDCGVKAVKFTTELDKKTLLLIGEINEENSQEYLDIKKWIELGGTAVYLQLPEGEKYLSETGWMFKYESKSLPFALDMADGKGLWIGHNHILHNHPVFDNLPNDGMMDNNWQNLIPQRSLKTDSTNWISGMITYDFYGGQDYKQHYIGVSEVYSSANIIMQEYKKGKVLYNTLPIVENLEKEPFAKRLLANLCEWLCNK